MERPLFIPVILGTARQGRESEHAAKFVFEQTKKRAGVETEFIDVRTLPMKLDDAGEQMKDPKFSATIERCDGLIIVTPEYNHSFPGLLKHALDINFGKVGSLFDQQVKLLDQNFVRRVDGFLNELIWMSRVLRHGRENIAPV